VFLHGPRYNTRRKLLTLCLFLPVREHQDRTDETVKKGAANPLDHRGGGVQAVISPNPVLDGRRTMTARKIAHRASMRLRKRMPATTVGMGWTIAGTG
jgi:hypothetical protein